MWKSPALSTATGFLLNATTSTGVNCVFFTSFRPSRPKPASPQVNTLPVVLNMALWLRPKTRLFTPSAPWFERWEKSTGRGSRTESDLPFADRPCPHCPLRFSPHIKTLPESVMTPLWEPPQATLMTLAPRRLGSSTLIIRGESQLLSSPWPSWPKYPVPQDITMPRSINNNTCRLPQATWTHLIGKWISRGDKEGKTLPLRVPQILSEPFLVKTTVNCEPHCISLTCSVSRADSSEFPKNVASFSLSLRSLYPKPSWPKKLEPAPNMTVPCISFRLNQVRYRYSSLWSMKVVGNESCHNKYQQNSDRFIESRSSIIFESFGGGVIR